MDDGKPCYPLESKAAPMTLPICHHRVHRPLLAVFCRTRDRPGVDFASHDWLETTEPRENACTVL